MPIARHNAQGQHHLTDRGMNASAFDSLAEILAATTQAGANTVIAFDANTSLTLQNVRKSSLAASDFQFTA